MAFCKAGIAFSDYLEEKASIVLGKAWKGQVIWIYFSLKRPDCKSRTYSNQYAETRRGGWESNSPGALFVKSKYPIGPSDALILPS
jgi:hypothetical protein